jgi:arginine deiminase
MSLVTRRPDVDVDQATVAFGVHSEVGELRTVMVCEPGRAHQRLTPTNCDALLFDDVMWVENARRDHRAFVAEMRARGVEVLEMHDLLTETVGMDEARRWLLDQQVVPNQVGLGLVDEVRSYLDGLSDRALAETLIGGLSTHDFPETHGGEMLTLVREAAGVTEYLLPPLPNTLYTRRHSSRRRSTATTQPLPDESPSGGVTPRATGAWPASRAET